MPGALAVVVGDLDGGLEANRPTGLAEAVAEVHVVEVEGEVFVEEAHFVQRGAPEREGGGHRLIHLARGGVIPVGHAVAAEGGAAGEEAGEADGVVEEGDRVGEAAAGALDGPVGEDELGGDSAGARVFGEGREEAAKGAGRDFGVGVEQEEEGGGGGADGLVVAGGESEVLGVGEEMDGGELARHHLRGAVVGGVVHDDDAAGRGLMDDRGEAGAKQVAGPPGYDADVEFRRRWCLHAATPTEIQGSSMRGRLPPGQ